MSDAPIRRPRVGLDRRRFARRHQARHHFARTSARFAAPTSQPVAARRAVLADDVTTGNAADGPNGVALLETAPVQVLADSAWGCMATEPPTPPWQALSTRWSSTAADPVGDLRQVHPRRPSTLGRCRPHGVEGHVLADHVRALGAACRWTEPRVVQRSLGQRAALGRGKQLSGRHPGT